VDITHYQTLALDIAGILEKGRSSATLSVNTILLQTYWEVGKTIVEFEQKGNIKAEYGKELLINISKELKKYGKGFSRSNLQYMRLFYISFPKMPDASGKLTWSHYVEILGISNDLARSFYEKQCILESVQKKTIFTKIRRTGVRNREILAE
jgi:predicted nuclease of restriction endonuclease-like (RecB) superfamily